MFLETSSVLAVFTLHLFFPDLRDADFLFSQTHHILLQSWQ